MAGRRRTGTARVNRMSQDLRAELERFLESLEIQTRCVEHPAVTVAPFLFLIILQYVRVFAWPFRVSHPAEVGVSVGRRCCRVVTCGVFLQVFTVEEMMPHLQDVSGVVAKNLFLKDKKKKTLFLVSTVHSCQVDLNQLAKSLGVGGGNLRFADESLMLEKLKVGQGCATALALLFDKDLSVQLVLDRALVEGPHPLVFFHPMTNTASLGLHPQDLLRFLEETGHKPILHNFP
ncbi:prolyl-tRNA synthetase associated domain-containing protein 1-like isoform X1 [Synchiropus splendidus]|uniref:prolyl-tRNA synthetase associated domain-containing protein 1-like isoform X1 n=1 Tax=Synchiropus splendidus TaxID=270530 RepID=UPI00237D7A69|nr:prolyl-tRNA synthetase associated domain-containing protein 1-like isoform X1 [Synchiropus splendidus]